jgi:hypothetical protein
VAVTITLRGPRPGGIARLLLLALVAIPAACRHRAVDRAVLDAWLTCVECTEGELASVQALAQNVPPTVDTLRSDLLHGVTGARLDRLRLQLEATYQLLAADRGGGGPRDSLPMSETRFVRQYLDMAVAVYRRRAAIALGAIGGPRARQSLDDALGLPPDNLDGTLREQVLFARRSLVTP